MKMFKKIYIYILFAKTHYNGGRWGPQSELASSLFDKLQPQPVDDCLRVLGCVLAAGPDCPPVLASHSRKASGRKKQEQVKVRMPLWSPRCSVGPHGCSCGPPDTVVAAVDSLVLPWMPWSPRGCPRGPLNAVWVPPKAAVACACLIRLVDHCVLRLFCMPFSSS